MPVKEVSASKSNNTRKNWSGGSNTQGYGNSKRMVLGRAKVGGKVRRHRGYTKVSFPGGFWDDVEKVTKVELVLTVAADGESTVITGDSARIKVRRNTANFKAGSKNSWSSADYTGHKVNTNQYQTVHANVGTGEHETTTTINVTNIVRQWAPKRVAFNGGKNGVGKDNHGFGITTRGDESRHADACEFYSAEEGAALFRPKLVLTYEQVNIKPTTQVAEPDGDVTSDYEYTGNFSGPEPEQYIARVKTNVRRKGKTDILHATNVTDPVISDIDGLWHIPGPPVGLLGKNITYQVQAAVWDSEGLRSDWTDWKDFVIRSNAPSITATPMGSHETMDNVYFEAPFTLDPSAGDMVKVDIELQERGKDWSNPLWKDSYPPTLAERNEKRVLTGYRGTNLDAGDYEWRARVTDALGGVSPWATDSTLTLTVGQPAEEYDQELTTGWNRLSVNQRILIRKLRSWDRGPGAIVAVIENAFNIGASWYATAPGELYFTLPSSHPQVSVIEPLATHYEYQQYRQGRWKTLAEGLIRDFDADDDEVVFYGLDYLGLLSLSIESAIQPEENPRKNISSSVDVTNGSRYFDKTIKFIIRDQLKRARLQDQYSPVRFIQTGRIDNFDTKVTIYASFAERLGFIRGLIDSHRGAILPDGGERRSRLRVRFNPAANAGQGRHEFEAIDNWGRDRDNLRLEYGSTIQGYQVIALDEFSTRIYAIGKEPNALRPYFRAVDAKGIDASKWGHLGSPAYYEDITDKADLKRRANALAIQRSRVGKRLALGLRVSGLDPFDGWDILDALPVLIQDGVVDTTLYGSGYWVIWGVEWRVYPDGHDEMTLIVRPRGDRADIDPDLIPSTPIHFKTDWKWGDGPPPTAVEPE